MAEITEVLTAGGLVIFPSETVYGAAVNALDQTAVEKLSRYKQRPPGKPYSIMVADKKMAEVYAEINPTAERIYKNLLPGPVTVVSKGKHVVATGVESETGTLGVRVPGYPFLFKLISEFGRPLTATSANASYKKRPYKVTDILDNISEAQKKLIDLIIDAGELPHNEPSTVIDTTYDDPVILRQGEITWGTNKQILSRSEAETQNFGKELWQKYEKYTGERSVVFALEGEMGAGKTQLTKGLGKAMGVKEEIISPTFNLELDYENETEKTKLAHFDAWRLQNGEELKDLGVEKLIKDKTVVVIEWADRVAKLIKSFDEEALVIWVKIEYGKGENERIIKWTEK